MATSTNVTSTNWSGAVMTAASGHSFSTVSAEWVVPTISSLSIKGVTTTDIAEWVGIDGYNSSDVAQAGIQEMVQTAPNGRTTISISAFDEWYPASSNTISAASFQVRPGNTIKVTVQTAGSGATSVSFTFDNITTGKIYTTDLSAPSGTSLHGNSAEFIVETPEVTIGHQQSQPLLSNFLGSPVVFQDASAIYQGQSAPIALSSAQTMGLWTNDVPGSLGRYVQEAYGSVQGDTITVTENDYWPDTPSFGVALLGSASTNQGLWELS